MFVAKINNGQGHKQKTLDFLKSHCKTKTATRPEGLHACARRGHLKGLLGFRVCLVLQAKGIKKILCLGFRV